MQISVACKVMSTLAVKQIDKARSWLNSIFNYQMMLGPTQDNISVVNLLYMKLYLSIEW